MAKRGKGKSAPEASPSRPDDEKEVNADLATSVEVKNDEEEMKDVEELKDGEEVKKDVEDEKEDEEEVEEDGEEVKKDEEVVEEDKETTNVVSGTEDKMEEDKKEEVKAEVNDVKAITKSKRKRLRKKNKPAAPAGEASAAKDSKKPATSEPVEKDTKKADSMGLIFMCSSKTKKDCYQYKVLGLPAAKKELVAKVYKGMRLFLFDIDLRLLYGVYKAAGPGGFNLEPKAFNSAFPSQKKNVVS